MHLYYDFNGKIKVRTFESLDIRNEILNNYSFKLNYYVYIIFQKEVIYLQRNQYFDMSGNPLAATASYIKVWQIFRSCKAYTSYEPVTASGYFLDGLGRYFNREESHAIGTISQVLSSATYLLQSINATKELQCLQKQYWGQIKIS